MLYYSPDAVIDPWLVDLWTKLDTLYPLTSGVSALPYKERCYRHYVTLRSSFVPQ